MNLANITIAAVIMENNAPNITILWAATTAPRIFFSSRTGRRFVVIYDADRYKRFSAIRLDQVKDVTIIKPDKDQPAYDIEKMALNYDDKTVVFISHNFSGKLIREYDFILDGTDNFPAKFLVNDACVMEKKPFSHAGIIRFKGQLMTYVPGQGPCYRCVFKNPPPADAVPTCKQAGVVGAMGGVIGSLQAMEAIKYITGVGELLTGYLLTYDAIKQEFHKVKLPSNTHSCAVCGDNPTITELVDYAQPTCELKQKH